MKRQILLQFSNITYFYYGLAAIKTIYGNDGFELDVLFAHYSEEWKKEVASYLKEIPQIRKVYFHSDKFSSKIQNLIKQKSPISKFKFNLYGKATLIKEHRKLFDNKN